MENSCTESADVGSRVQHITKATSDELLNKFAQVGGNSDNENKMNRLAIVKKKKKKKELRLPKQQRKNIRSRLNLDEGGSNCESPSSACGVAEKKLLLPVASRRSGTLIRQLGIVKAKIRARNLRNKLFFGAIEKVRLYHHFYSH